MPHTATGAPSASAACGSVTGAHDAIADLDQRRGVTGLLAALGDDDRQHVAGVAGVTADGDHHRPVLVDDAHPQFTGDVGGGEHGDDTGRGLGGGGVERQDLGAGVSSEVQRGMQHAGHAHVVDVVAVAERQRAGLVLDTGSAHGCGERRLELLAFGDSVDGLEDLHVPGATAQVGAEMTGHVGGLEVGTLLVDLGLGAHHDAGDAEPALQATARGERVGERGTLGRGHAFEGDHRAPCGLGQRLLAADDGLAVDVHGAAPALARG